MISIDLLDGSPKYKQLVEQIKRAVISDELKPGERMPTTRELSQTLQVNIATVARAYQMLKREGILGIRRGLGTYVLKSIDYSESSSNRRNRLLALTDRLIQNTFSQGYDPEELHSLLIRQIARSTYRVGAHKIR
jgi:GntR family transcriptional regulator